MHEEAVRERKMQRETYLGVLDLEVLVGKFGTIDRLASSTLVEQKNRGQQEED